MNAKLYRSEECHCLNNIEPLKMKVYSKIADISKWDTDTNDRAQKEVSVFASCCVCGIDPG